MLDLGVTSLELRRSDGGDTPWRVYGALSPDPEHDWALGAPPDSPELAELPVERLERVAAAAPDCQAAWAQVQRAFRTSGAEKLVFRLLPDPPALFLGAIHSTALAPPDRSGPVVAGGLRRWADDEESADVIVQTLHHARAVTCKAALAQLPWGGAKLAVVVDPQCSEEAFYRWVAWCIDQARCITGLDQGLTPEEVEVIRRFTPLVVGGASSPLGPTSMAAAEGVVGAIEVALEHLGWKGGLRGRTAAIQGVGEVGQRVAELLLERGADIWLADVVEARVAAFLRSHAHFRGRIRTCSADLVLFLPVDVVVPCAHAGVFSPPVIDRLRCRVAFAAANNDLAAFDRIGEEALARQLARRGILYQVSWAHNGGGLLQAVQEYEAPMSVSFARLQQRIDEVIVEGTRRRLAAASRTSTTPTEQAWAEVDDVLAAVERLKQSSS